MADKKVSAFSAKTTVASTDLLHVVTPSVSNNKITVSDFRGYADVRDYGAVGNGTTDDSAAIQSAIDSGKSVYIPAGTYLIGSSLTVDDTDKITIRGDGRELSIIKKGFNGDMITLGQDSTLDDLKLDGDGSTYTGTGVQITSGSVGAGYQRIMNCHIEDMASYCVEYTANAAGWGGGIKSCHLGTTSGTAACIKYPATETNGNRTIIDTVTFDGPFADFDACATTMVSGCTMSAVPIFSDDTKKVSMSGNRITGGDLELDGTNHAIVGNICAADITLLSGLTSSIIDGNIHTGINDNSGQTSNRVSLGPLPYTPTWDSTGTSPALGNGSISGNYQREGKRIDVWISLTMGSTTTYGTGNYTLSLPVTAGTYGFFHVGTVLAKDATDSVGYVGVCQILSAGTTMSIKFHANAAEWSSGSPITWASGDTLVLHASYLMSSAAHL